MNNKVAGNNFEQELCEVLFNYGFWSHCMKSHNDGQPADIIAVKNKKAYLIDAKVCAKRFTLSRIEDNQEHSMSLWHECGNGQGWFALKVENEIYMISHFLLNGYKKAGVKSLNFEQIKEIGKPLEMWVSICK